MKTSEFDFPDAISLTRPSDNFTGQVYEESRTNKEYALITGASRGIGEALAHECAAQGMDLILVALPGEKLAAVQETLARQYRVRVQAYETDLTQPGAPEALYQWCVENGFTVSTLVNNAGIGQQGSFENASIGGKLSLLQINMLVPVSLVHHFLPMLKERKESFILNVGSMASFVPIPYKCLYSASKTFVLSFSRSLRFELKDTSIKVSCLCPGPTLTNAQNRQNTRSVGRRGTLLEMGARPVARAAVAGMLSGKEIIIPGWKHRFIEFFSRCLPAIWTIRYTGNMFSVSKHNVHVNS
jgi:short-subunit dehydrogenase